MRKYRNKFFSFIFILLISNVIAFFLSSDRRWIPLFLKEKSDTNPNIEIPLAIGEWKGEQLPIQGNGRLMYIYKSPPAPNVGGLPPSTGAGGEELELFIVFKEGINFTRPFECLPSIGWRVFLNGNLAY